MAILVCCIFATNCTFEIDSSWVCKPAPGSIFSQLTYLRVKSSHIKYLRRFFFSRLDEGIRLNLILSSWSKGPFLYYVRVFSGFFEPPSHLRKDILLHKVRENCHFLDHPPTPLSLRNIKMAPWLECKKVQYLLDKIMEKRPLWLGVSVDVR